MLVQFFLMSVMTIMSNGFTDPQVSDSTADIYWLEHAIDLNDFKEIGSLNLKIIKQSHYAAQFQNYNSEYDQLSDEFTRTSHHSTQIESNQFDQSTRQELKNAYETNKNSFYRLRLVKKQLNTLVYVTSSFTYLKNLIHSDFAINLTLNTGFTGRLNSISIKTTPIKTDTPQKNIVDFDYLTIYASVQNIKPGQSPETDAYLEKVKKELEQKEKGAQGDNQSFFSKYWIYIVPVVVIMFLSNLVNPEGGPGAAGSR
jgi:hypothetical protein